MSGRKPGLKCGESSSLLRHRTSTSNSKVKLGTNKSTDNCGIQSKKRSLQKKEEGSSVVEVV